MFATCIFCHSSLGANESIEHFPVGKRLAFDAAKGRLWVVCKKCGRWNLSPIEERWEAIEEAERSYRDAKKRVATDNIGLARMRDGTDLIRIGEPLRPEFAAWRYGDRFGTRYFKRMVVGGVAIATGVGLVAATSVGISSVISASLMVGTAAQNARFLGGLVNPLFPRLRIVANDGLVIKMSAEGVRSVMVMSRYSGASDTEFTVHIRGAGAKRPRMPIGPNASLLVRVVRPRASEVISGDAGRLALSKIMAVSNNLTGSSKDLSSALTLLEGMPSTSALLQSLPAQSFAPWFIPKSSKRFRGSSNIQLISRLPASVRLALEMSLHETDERRALSGELAELEHRWREAEEIAAIADNMFLPPKAD